MRDTAKQAEYFKAWYALNREDKKSKSLTNWNVKFKFLAELKERTPCTDCGTKYPYYVMQFDHVGSDKFRPVGKMCSYSWERLIAEIDKCEIVCANCHAARTWRRNKPPEP